MFQLILELLLPIFMQKASASEDWALRMLAARDALQATSGSEVVVAVIDTGGDIHHPDLVNHLWTNPGETGIDDKGRDKATNGIDDDGNGFIDDVHGWNFINNNSNLRDNHGHGTHIGGIISRVAPKARLMFLKYYDPKSNPSSTISSAVRAIQYATRMGAKIINFSAGGRLPYAEEKAAIMKARDAGILFVAAAGNDGLNTDILPYYPASYGLSNILSVAAVDQKEKLLSTSNFGKRTVHIAAPGDAILSSLPHAQRGFMTGTSQATAFASGIAALLMSDRRLKLSPEDCIAHLMRTGKINEKLKDIQSRAILNAQRALAIQGRDLTTINVGSINPRYFSPEMAYPLENRSKR